MTREDRFIDHTAWTGCHDFYLRIWEAGPHENFHVVIGDSLTGQGVIVDPTFRLPEIFERAERDGVPIQAAVFTHGHWDHFGGVEEATNLGVKTFFVPELLAEEVAKRTTAKVIPIQDGSTFAYGEARFQAIHAPGHQPEHMLYLVGREDEQTVLLTGDVLFIDSCGRADFPGGDPKALFQSIQRILDLNVDPLVIGGHNYGHVAAEKLSAQKQRNPALTQDWDAFRVLPFLKGD